MRTMVSITAAVPRAPTGASLTAPAGTIHVTSAGGTGEAGRPAQHIRPCYIAFAAAPICGHDRGQQFVVMAEPVEEDKESGIILD